MYAADASEEGGGACVSTGLSEWGHHRCHSLSYARGEVEGAAADDLLVIEMFSGMGGLKQALELLGLMPQGVVSVDNDPLSRKITRAHCRHAITIDDARAITKEMVYEWRRQFPLVTKVLVAGGWPCINHSSLNINRQGASGATSLLVESLIQVRDWLLEASAAHQLPPWTVIELYENVLMDQADLEVRSDKLGWYPMYFEAADLAVCRRPRLYWLRNLALVPGKDLTIQLQGRVRGLDMARFR